MPCYHPLGGYLHPQTNGKFRLSIQKGYVPGHDPPPLVNPVSGEVTEFIRIPCGKCIGCRLDYSRHWADRMSLEALTYPESECWFLTLTYNDADLPPVGPLGVHTLLPRDVTLFLKRFRKDVHEIRYLYCGEYGSTTFRPHYHMILYGYHFPDKVYFKANDDGDPIYTSLELEEVWGKGFCTLAPFSWSTAAYTARYVVKKLKGPGSREYYDQAGLYPEFIRMSRRPGIGAAYMNEHLDEIFSRDQISLAQGKRSKPPKYADRLLEKVDPIRFAKIKSQRRLFMDETQREKLLYTDRSLERILLDEEFDKLEKIRSLVRDDL